MNNIKKLVMIMTLSAIVFAESKLSGVAYFGYEDNFSLSRVYFTYKKSISDDLSFKFQTDVGRIDNLELESGEEVYNDKRWMVFLKKAHLDWKIANKTNLSMGMIGMNMLNIQEKTWGYRFLRKSALDQYKLSATADLGVSVSKDFGFLYTNLTMTNGEGYKESVVDDNNKISIQLVHGERSLDKNDGYNIGLVYSTVMDDNDDETTVMGLFGGWAGNNMRIGAELNTQNEEEVISEVTSIYLNYNINDDFSAFVRQDAKDEDVDTDGGDESTMMVGVIWQPKKGLSICPNITQIDDEDTFSLDFQFKF